MRRYAVPVAVVAAAIALLLALVVGLHSQKANNSIAYAVASHHYRSAPDSDRKMPVISQGATKTRSLASYRGRYVLINVFASWCPDCQVESKAIAQAQQVLRAHGGTVIGVPYRDSPGEALGFARRYDATYPLLEDNDGKLAAALNVDNIPDSYLIDPQGRIVALNTVYVTSAWVKNTLAPTIAAGI